MQTQTLSSRLSFKPQALDALTIESALAPADVIENIRDAGKEWRPSKVPEDLKRLGVQGLAVKISGFDFEMHWGGNISPFYNPVMYGAVDWAPIGSRIRVGFGLNRRTLQSIGLYAVMAILPLFNTRNKVTWILFALMAISLAGWGLYNRKRGPMRTRLMEIVSNVANQARQLPAEEPNRF